MPLRLSPAVVVGIVLIVLVPVLNLSLSPGYWSTRVFRLANSFRVDHDKVEAHGLNIRHQNELLVGRHKLMVAHSSTRSVMCPTSRLCTCL